jgi:hypothetical protein
MNDHAAVEKEAIENFLTRVPPKAVDNHTQLVAYFGYFLMEELGQTDVTSKSVRACYDSALIAAPANIPDTMRKSNAFVQTKAGTLLSREAKVRVQQSLLATAPAAKQADSSPMNGNLSEKSKNVVVVHGRDLKIRDSMFDFLRSIGLAPVEWNEAVRRTGSGSPYNGQVVDALFKDAQAIVVLFSPDEHVELRTDLQDRHDGDNSGWQPRPNVFIEAGMALARDEAHTILVQIGMVRHASDLIGRNLVHFDGSSTQRHNLVERLRTAGCAISNSGSDWLRTGNFEVPPTLFNGKRRKGK